MRSFLKPLWAAALLFPLQAAMAQTPVYLDDSKPIEDRVEDALSRMTLEEKVALCHAQSKFSSAGVPRLGLPENWMTDGPHGIRPEVAWDEWYQAGWTNDSCMAFPALTCLAATWNPDMSLRYGRAIGEEARYRNKNVLLGPGVNIYRTPLNGRNFEYMGEDPYLASEMVVPYIQGVQSCGVAACVKHFALNNQEYDRFGVDVEVSDRALYEIYLPAFKAAVQRGEAWAIMGSYNLYRGQHCCHNQRLLNDILRGEWGFDGVVVSDWGGVHNTREAAYNGLDMEFGTGTDGLSVSASDAYNHYFLARPFLEQIKAGVIPESVVDGKVRNILRMMFRTTMNPNRPYGSFEDPAHGEAARQIAEEGIVLLQNRDNTLPIQLEKTRKILVVGENAIKMMTVGGGSSSLKAQYEISPLDGLRARVGSAAEVVYARGYVGNIDGSYNGVVSKVDLSESRSADELLAEAVALAREADYVIFVGGLNKNSHQDCEGGDRYDYGLPYNQDRLIEALAEVNPRTVVVLVSGNSVAMPWADRVGAIVEGWYCGSEAGNALAAVLTGDVNPSGKLPFTMCTRLEDYHAHALNDSLVYPGVNHREVYKDDIFVGYRWSDKQKKNRRPLFCFGHGLSYTTFEYGKAVLDRKQMTAADSLRVRVSVKNTGSRAGAEVVQLYVSDLKSSLPRPIKELKGFRKVMLQPGESREVEFVLDRTSLSYFDDAKHAWVAEPGRFEVLIGASAEDIRSRVGFELK